MLRYLFVDMNSFFASVEQQEHPHLRGQPVGVVPILADTTCCIAASYEARDYGVKTGTGVRDARRLCPNIHLVVGRPQVYVRYHHKIVDAVESCLHVDMICSVDEMYGRLMGPQRRPEQAAALAHQVKAAIRQAVGACMRCSIGVAPNAWLAKVASGMQKPDGLTMILPEQMPEAICKLDLTELPGIGRNMLRRLRKHGIERVDQLCGLSQKQLSQIWGSEVLGSIWWHQLRGYDLPYRPTHRRTVGHSHVLPPEWRTNERAHAVLVWMIHKAAARLRRIHYWAGQLTVWVKYRKGPTWQRREHLGSSRDTLTILQAFERAWREHPAGVPYHVGVVLSDLIADRSATLPLYPQQVRRDALADVMDRLNRRYGYHVLYFAGMFGAQRTAPTRISFTQVPDDSEFERTSVQTTRLSSKQIIPIIRCVDSTL